MPLKTLRNLGHHAPGRRAAAKEPATTVCLAMRLGPTSFGVVTAFPDDAGRRAHMAANADVLEQAGQLLTQPPSIERLEVIAAKLPNR